MQAEMLDFIKGNKIASICCSKGNAPYCFQCFYVYHEAEQLLLFKSADSTQHAQMLAQNHLVAGSILPDKLNFLALKGIQFTGQILSENFPGGISPSQYYHAKLPIAIAKPGRVWCIQLEWAKMTDNSRVFSQKLKWSRIEMPQQPS